MKYGTWFRIFLLSSLIFVMSCSTVPITGRQQVSLVPSALVSNMAAQEYSAFLKEADVVTGTQEAQMVQTVGNRIAAAVERYFKAQDMADEIEDYKWEFNLVESDEENAWAMPGGKVVIYEGILPVTQNENGLAVVMSHEIAHVLANHGKERMSQGLLAQLGGVALSEAMANRPEQTRAIFLQSYAIGSQVGVLLPYSRLQEREADRLGMIFMAMAGYDPRGAVPFWRRMANAKEGQGAPPEFLSTHPSDASRIAYIEEVLPEAMEYYDGPGGASQATPNGEPAVSGIVETPAPPSPQPQPKPKPQPQPQPAPVFPDDDWRYGDPVE